MTNNNKRKTSYIFQRKTNIQYVLIIKKHLYTIMTIYRIDIRVIFHDNLFIVLDLLSTKIVNNNK